MERNVSFGTLDHSLGPGCRTDSEILDPNTGNAFFDFSPSPSCRDAVVPPDIAVDDEVNGVGDDERVTSGAVDSEPAKKNLSRRGSEDEDENFVEASECLRSEDEDDRDHAVDVHEDERAQMDLKEKDKLVFILSEAGKPIYCRFGNEEKHVTLFGLMQALVFCVKDNDDEIKSVTAGDYLIVFLGKGPLIFVAVSRRGETAGQLALHLSYVQSLIVSVLTAASVKKIFEQRRNYDLRKLLGGADRLMDNLLNSLESDPSFLLGAVSCLPLHPNIRETISDAIVRHCGKVKNVVFAILLADSQLVALVRMKKYMLHPADLHILINLVASSESFKMSESWTPICLPRFNANGFLHAHVSYLADDCQACLLLLTVDKDQFFVLSEAKQGIVQRLRRYKCLEQINEAMEAGGYTVRDVKIPEIRHFLYKARPTAQFTAPVFSAPYDTPGEKDRLMALYHRLHDRMIGPSPSGSRSAKLVYAVGKYECVLCWVTAYFELYAAVEPLVEKEVVIPKVEKLLNWIREEDNRLFILTASTF